MTDQTVRPSRRGMAGLHETCEREVFAADRSDRAGGRQWTRRPPPPHMHAMSRPRPSHLAEAEPENAPIDPAQAAALVPEQLLQPGEIVILLLKPSAWYILLASLRGLAIIGLVYLLARLLEAEILDWFGLDGRDVLLLALAAAGARLFWQFLEWLSRVYVLTDRRIIRIEGVIRVYVFETALKHVQHTDVYMTLRERLFGLGTIGFSTAGSGTVDAYWMMLAQPLEVHRKVVQTLHRYR